MSRNRYVHPGSLRDVESFRRHLSEQGLMIPCDPELAPPGSSPLAEPLRRGEIEIGNRIAIHPMEGWDGTPDGQPSDLTVRRWQRFGRSGAKLIWGGEAVAVRRDGRANPNQLLIAEGTLAGLEGLRRTLVEAHTARLGSAAGLVVGLQLTHSGRFSRPRRHDLPEPRAAYRHPILDRRTGVNDDRSLLTDGELEGLIGDFAAAARRARDLGFHFVDLKCCHGYLLHELLGARTRAGPYGGTFENRTRFLREVVAAVRREAPGLELGVRVSVFDVVPYRAGPAAGPGSGGAVTPGVPEDTSGLLPYRWGFGVGADDPTRPDLGEARRLLGLLRELGIRLVNLSAGSPYYNPHIQRPALYPPSDGYAPPEDPLCGVARQLLAARDLKRDFADLVVVGSAFSYLQEYIPHVAQAVVRAGWMDAAGLGRVMLSYPELPADSLEHGRLERRRLCRTFSDCTTAPRAGLVSGCYPLDDHYAALPAAAALRALKKKK